MHACQDAFHTIFKGHLVAAACVELGIEGPDDELLTDQRVDQELLEQVVKMVVSKFSIIPEAILGEAVADSSDGVYNYTRLLCHFASLTELFVDAWSEGDGERIITYWKVFMLHFHASRRTKYALEALRIQFQLASLQPYLAHQLTWGRFINTHGGSGHNLPCDLHNEHINKLFKEIVANMGANFTEEASTRAARSVSSLDKMAKRFDHQASIHPEATAHSRKSDGKDVKIVVEVVKTSRLLQHIEGRSHSNFPNFPVNPLHKLNRDAMNKWITTKAKEYNRFTVTTELESEEEED